MTWNWPADFQDTLQWISIFVCLIATARLAKNQSDGFGEIADLLRDKNKE